MFAVRMLVVDVIFGK